MRRRIRVAMVLTALVWAISPNLLRAHADISIPGAPSNVSAQAGNLSATVQWTPADSQATSYTVTSNPRGITATVAGTASSATVTGLAFARSYTFTVAGTNGIGTGPSSSPSNPVTPQAPGGPYHQGATRVLADTDVAAGTAVKFNIGEDRVHFPGLSAVVLNVTASAASQASAVQLVVQGQIVATVSVAPGLVESSLAVVPVVGQMNPAVVQVSAGQAHVEIDFVGLFTGAGTVGDRSGLLQMIRTTTVLDSAIAADSSIDVSVLGKGDVPLAGVAGVLLNVTAINPGGVGALSVLPQGIVDPGTTALGFGAGQTTANRMIVPVPANGTITLLDRGAATDARLEILGWFSDGTDSDAVGALYTATTPTRELDAAEPAGASVTFPIWGQAGTPDGAAPGPATSALVDVTVTSPAGAGSIVISGTSVVDFGAGQTVGGTDLVPITMPSGSASLLVLGAAANVTVDLVAFFSGDLIMPGSTKVLTPTQLAGITDLSGSSITFAPGVQISPPVMLNDVINAGSSAATPHGLLRRVLSISTASDGSTVLGTRSASVPEALTTFFLDWTLPPIAGAFAMGHGKSAQTIAAAAPVNANPLPPPPGTSIDPNWPSFGIAKPPQGVMVDLATKNPGLQSGSEIDINDLEDQARINLVHGLTPSGKLTLHIGFGVGVRASIDIQLLAQVTLLDVPHILETFFPIGPPIFIVIGFFILEFEPGIDASLEFRVSLAGGAILHLGLDRYIELSGGYDGKNFFVDPITNKDYLTPQQEFNWRPSIQLEFELDVHLDPAIAWYGGIGVIEADPVAFARFTVDPTAPHWWDVTLGICRSFEFKLNLVFLTADVTTPPVCLTLTALEAPGRLLAITITPSSATVARSGTQHFHASVPLSNNGVVWSIDESGGGALSNTTEFDVDYTAPLTAGKYHLRAEAVDDPTSAIEVAITVPVVAPTSPLGVVAVLTGPTTASVAWTAPTDDGGAPITTYFVLVAPSNSIFPVNAPGNFVIPVNAPNTSTSINALNPGTTYTFGVSASNKANLVSVPGVSNSITTPPAGPMSVNPTSINFGNITLGQSSQPQTVVITADGVPLVISTVTVTGTNPGEFPIQNDLCSGQTVQPGSSCSFAIMYTPTQQISASATVSISDSDATSPQTVTLSGSSPVQAVSGVVSVFDIQMVDSQTGYALEGGLGSAVLKTTDGGKTWNRLILPAFDQVNNTGGGYNLRFVDANHGFIGAFRSLSPAGRVQFILGTSDGGQTWQQINIPSGIGLESLWFADATHGWILGGVAGPPPPPGSLVNSVLMAVYATTDGGATWSLQTAPDPIIAGTPGCIGQEANVSAAFTDALHGWISSAVLCFAPNLTITTRGALLWTTSDGGTTWTPHQPSGVISINDRVQATGPSQVRQEGVVQVTSTSFEQVLVSSEDGGGSFSITPLPAQNVQIAAVTFSDGAHGVFVTGDGHVFRTTDGGSTWQGSALPRFASTAGHITSYSYQAVASPDGTNIWITGGVSYGLAAGGFIEMSSNGGSTWIVQLLGSGA